MKSTAAFITETFGNKKKKSTDDQLVIGEILRLNLTLKNRVIIELIEAR